METREREGDREGLLERGGSAPGSWGSSVGRASVPRTLLKLCPHHVLSRPRFGALRSSQDKWRGSPLERPLPKEQVPPLERGPPPEQPHWMTPEYSKCGVWGQVGGEGLDQSSKRLWAMVPLYCRHTTVPKGPDTPLQCPRTKHLRSASSHATPIPRGPGEG